MHLKNCWCLFVIKNFNLQKKMYHRKEKSIHFNQECADAYQGVIIARRTGNVHILEKLHQRFAIGHNFNPNRCVVNVVPSSFLPGHQSATAQG